MNVINERRGELSAIPFLNNALDGLISRINLVFRKEHNDDGTHTDITADTVTVTESVVFGTDNSLAGETVGPDLFAAYDSYPSLALTANATRSAVAVERDLIPDVDDENYLGWLSSGLFVRRWRALYVSRVVHGPTIAATSLLSSEGAVVLSGSISASITADQNDWSPTGLSAARIIRLQTDASRTITGLVAQSNHILTIINIDTNDAVLAHESGLSSAFNRFICPGGVNYTLTVGSAATIWHDGTRWRFMHS